MPKSKPLKQFPIDLETGEPISPKTGKPYRKQSEAQKIATEFNWMICQVTSAFNTLARARGQGYLGIDNKAKSIAVIYQTDLGYVRQALEKERDRRIKEIKNKNTA